MRKATSSNDGVGEFGDGGDDDGLRREAVLRVEVGGIEVDLKESEEGRSELKEDGRRARRSRRTSSRAAFLIAGWRTIWGEALKEAGENWSVRD